MWYCLPRVIKMRVCRQLKRKTIHYTSLNRMAYVGFRSCHLLQVCERRIRCSIAVHQHQAESVEGPRMHVHENVRLEHFLYRLSIHTCGELS